MIDVDALLKIQKKENAQTKKTQSKPKSQEIAILMLQADYWSNEAKYYISTISNPDYNEGVSRLFQDAQNRLNTIIEEIKQKQGV
jgi:hypothetical protein